jgi:hypothetical protein
MKTWEMYNYAMKNKSQKFLRKRYGQICQFNDKGELKIVDKPNEYPLAGLDEEWELAPREVPWQEAMQARIDGQGFYIEYNGHKYEQKNYRRIGCLESDDERDKGDIDGFYGEMFKTGKWYIEY